MKVTIAAVLLVMSASVFAGGPVFSSGRDSVSVTTSGPPDNYNDFPNVAKSVAKSDSSSLSVSEGGSAFAYGGKGGAGGSSSSSSGVVINEAKIPSDVRIRNTPDVTTMPAMTTASCIKGFGIGAGAAGVGGGLSWSVKDDECEGRAWAAHFLQTGRPQMAVNMECGVKRVRDANPRECGAMTK